MRRLYKELENYGKSDFYPFHMPGHKRNKACIEGDFPIERDITEIDGFDDLHHSEGILLEAQNALSRMYGTRKSFFSVNGSTAGILTAISASVKKGGQILVARNCHKAVYHAIYLRELVPTYIYPQSDNDLGINGSISVSRVERYLEENPKIEAVLITSPTYDGVVSDIEAICEIVHRHRVPVIVDEAHGAHFCFSDYFPKSAVACGADVVIQSTHKTLPAMTQTALIHLNGDLIDRERIRRMLTIYQTSSPSYILMGSIDGCLHMLSENGEMLYKAYTERLQKLRNAIHEQCRWIKLPEYEELDAACSKDYDKSKIVLSVRNTGMTGRQFHEILLHDYHLQMEMVSAEYVLAMTAVGDSEEGYERLLHALVETDAKINAMLAQNEAKKDALDEEEKLHDWAKLPVVSQKMTIYDAEQRKKILCRLDDAAGEIAADYIYLYPPGIPIVTPGEMITGAVIGTIHWWLSDGLHVSGVYEERDVRIIC